MLKITLDETEYTTSLAIALNNYVQAKTGSVLPSPLTPHSKRQSYKNLNKSLCFDLIQRLTESSLLVLEVKVTHDGRKLHSFNAQQRRIDAALRAVGIPLEYCYNISNDYTEKNDPVYTLKKTLSSHPVHVSDDKGIIVDDSTHQTLKEVVDRLIEADQGNAEMVGALFNKNLIKSMRELNIKVLFFAYHTDSLELFDEKDLFSLYDSYRSHVNLGSGVDVRNAGSAELQAEFKHNAQQLFDVLSNWQQEKSSTLRHRPSTDMGM
ncbi:hypothetical protein [Pseudomonas quasicaspiana]|uniref:hypothetical protein n=1 Tax=Pseudomonas quasicaspiana TaxID=2829821 RepID=UPI001E3C7BBD|nr:hypothetical protein [Pseudomonas quasicaspiana]MCD5971522.1 hypothetical protein [Pseudomonas quasicaspiana]